MNDKRLTIPSSSQTIVERAHRRYTNSVLQGSSPCRTDGDSIAQSSNYGMASERMELRADQVREVLMGHGVQLIQFVPYRNFGLHVDKLVRPSAQGQSPQTIVALRRPLSATANC